MSAPAVHTGTVCEGKTRPYRSLSLLGEIELIAHAGDRLAWEEFHAHRPVFRLNGSRPLLFVKFVDALRDVTAAQKFAGRESAVLERAYDLTIDKYTNLDDADGNNTSAKRKGPDCRYYFQKVVDSVNTWKRRHPNANPLRLETAVVKTLQRHVVRRFCLACLEARRSVNPARTRYAWQLDEGVVYVWMPAWLHGRHRRDWLQANVEDADPSRPGEQRRVRDIIDERLGLLGNRTLGGRADQAPSHHPADQPMTWLIEHEITVRGLAQVVADEKGHTLHRQRPAIRALGKPSLRRLILRIFEGISEDHYRDGVLARAFGLSKATFSRFAGSRWRIQLGGPTPDLWANTAGVLAHHTAFIETAKEAGVWPQVTQVLRESYQEVHP